MKLLAFVHIEKAAGTSLIHILRYNYFMSYLDVRPLRKNSNGLFTAHDLKLSKRILPGLKCIGGHSVKPISDLESIEPDIQYITFLREPINRYLSQYQYWCERLGKTASFEEYMDLDGPKNFQTKKIAGKVDVELAKEILKDKFLLVGFVENFDEFLVLLKRKLKPAHFDPRFSKKNLARNKVKTKGYARQFYNEIIENNRLDIELYDYVKSDIYPKYFDQYGPSFAMDFTSFKDLNKTSQPFWLPKVIDYLIRKFYVHPITSIMRILNGLPAKGSY